MGKASRKKHLQKQTKQFAGQLKLSEAILKICDPYMPMDDLEKNELEKLVTVAVIAWNIASLPQEKQADELMRFIEFVPNMKDELMEDVAKMEELGDILPEEDLSIGSITLQIISDMLRRKEELYPDDKRRIVDFVIDEKLNGYNIKISSVCQ